MWNLLKPLIGPVVEKLVDRIPDPNARAEAKEEMERELLNAVQMASQAQTEINKQEAKHSSVFVAGWRPFIGWICGIGLLWAYIAEPTVSWAVTIWAPSVKTLPSIDTGSLYQLVLGMLGMGALRSWEKTKGVAREKSPTAGEKTGLIGRVFNR